MTFAVVIVAWNGEQHIEACLRSVLDQSHPPAHVVLVDNASEDATMACVARSESAAVARGIAFSVVRETENTGFTKGANTGLTRCMCADTPADAVVLLNQDAELDHAWCAAVARVLDTDARIGAVGARILQPDRQALRHAGGWLEQPRLRGTHIGIGEAESAGTFMAVSDVEFVTGAAMALRVDALRDVGGFNEIFSPGYYEDVELCDRLRRSGWRVVYAPLAVATHIEAASFGLRGDRVSLSHRNRLIYALPSLVEPQFRLEFCAAERRAFALDSPEERRALALAYLLMILALPEAVKARLSSEVATASLVLELVEMFKSLREDALVSLRSDRRALDVGEPVASMEIG